VHPIMFIQDNNNYINQVEFMSYYMMTATNKWYSYLRVAAI
jgi:hypothetical protein